MIKTVKADDKIQEEILRAAINLYRKHGPAKVTMDEVANATGRSRTSLYYYYKNREEIFRAVLDTIVDDVIAEIKRDVNNAGTIHEKIHAFCSAKITTSGRWRYVFKAMWDSMNAEEQTKHTKIMEALHSKLVYKEGLIIKEILSESIGKNEIRPITATEQDMLGFILSSSVRGLRNEIHYKNDPHDMKEALSMLSDIISSWILK
ncbi:TetR/AcrR family transcriptional regulator [Mucilaginibacter sp. dw_454]|uniref:TetR/AcrR family transcriptional regulator n=1 Tax=Mucilaginibacter sp. dw_454 TaxID=2720079 RepID=UPI001BD66697